METINTKIDRILTKLLIKYPKKFPSYFSNKFKDINISKDDGIQNVSFFSEDFCWESINVTVQISMQSYNKIIQEYFTETIGESVNMESTYKPHMKGTKVIGAIELKNKYFSKCKVSTSNLSFGKAYLHLKFLVKDEISRKINNLNVSHAEGIIEFNKKSFFNDRPKAKFISAIGIARRTLRDEIDKVIEVSKVLSKKIIKKYKINKINKHSVVVTVFKFEHETINQCAEQKMSILIRKNHINKKSEVERNIYQIPGGVVSNKLDRIVFKNGDVDNLTLRKWPIEYLSITIMLRKKFRSISNETSKALLSRSSIEKKYKDLFSCSEAIYSLNEKINSIKDYANESPLKTLNKYIQNESSKILEETNDLKKIVDGRLKKSSDSLEIRHINITKTLSIVVVILTIFQLVLAFSDNYEEIRKFTQKLFLFLNGY